MLLLLRIAVALFVALSWIWRRQLGQMEVWSGRSFFVDVSRHKGNITGFDIATPTRLDARFSFDRERKLDAWMRAAGIVTEVQTNDRGFDDKVFIACDDEGVHARLKHDAALRTAVAAVLDRPAGRVYSDGRHVHLHTRTAGPPTGEDFAALHQITMLIEAARRPGRRLDPFILRVAAIEVVLGTLLAYGIGGAVAFIIATRRVDLFFSTSDFTLTAMAVGAVLTVVGLLFLALVVRGSSRAWRVIADGVFMLALAVPTGALALTVDLNEHLDGRPLVVPVRVEGLHTEEHLGNKGSRYTTWHVSLEVVDAPSSAITIPRHVTITKETSDRLSRGVVAQAVVGRGALGLPYWIALRPEPSP